MEEILINSAYGLDFNEIARPVVSACRGDIFAAAYFMFFSTVMIIKNIVARNVKIPVSETPCRRGRLLII